ncbi:pyruvate kinase [Christensenellaceae bacterium OttesenSCG-928-K19]|nr:pyruvate kinase [Christensenellaceae bacterium OttesenSCG-928-K19]
MRKTKIVCTLGPACEDKKILEEMILAGMDVARFNFSHGDHEEQAGRLKKIRSTAKKMDRFIPCLLDTKGPEIRIGTFEKDEVTLVEGQQFVLTTQDVQGDESRVSISFKELPNDVHPGDSILIDDGLVALTVQNVTDSDILCTVVNGGLVGNKKGVNIPGIRLSLPYMSEKDKADIIFGIENNFEFIAASFTRTAQDILDIKNILDDYGNEKIRVIAKIENAEGVANINDILRISDGIMVARGDMGVEIPLENVPVLQKQLIRKAYNAGKIVITATQMLDSMMHNPRPTRAESTDVSTAIYEGTSAVMLSGETAAGKYPVESVETMARIALRTESDIDYRLQFHTEDKFDNKCNDVTTAISHAACTTAYDLNASAIIAVTKTGQSARLVSKYRPSIPIIGSSPDAMVLNQLNMSWGVIPLAMEEKKLTDELFESAVYNAKEKGLLKDGDVVVITAGIPLGVSGTTNLLKVHMVGDVLVKGMGINELCARAPLCVAHTEEEAQQDFKNGDILVISRTSNEILDLMKRSAGIITEEGGLESHAAIVGMALEKPVIVGAAGATSILKSGTLAKLDAESGLVSIVKDQNLKNLKK